jgi:signal transduction histidine kinase
MTNGKRDARQMLSAAARVSGHASTGPSGMAFQSMQRMSVDIGSESSKRSGRAISVLITPSRVLRCDSPDANVRPRSLGENVRELSIALIARAALNCPGSLRQLDLCILIFMGEGDGSFDTAQVNVLEQVASGKALPQVLEAIVGLIERQAEGMLCTLLLFDKEHRCLRHGAAPSLPPQYVEAIDGAAIGPDAGSCGAAAHTLEQVVVTNIATHPHWVKFRHLALPHGLLACWSTPVLSADHELLGTFAMYYRERRGPSDRERTWVAAGAHLAAVAITRDRAEQSLRQSEARAKQLARLYAVSSGVSEALVRCRDPLKLYERACQIVVEEGLAVLAWIGLYDEAGHRIRAVARFGKDAGLDAVLSRPRQQDERARQGPAVRALHTGEPSISNDIASDPEFHFKAEALARGMRSCAAFPLRLGERTRGVLVIYGETPGFFRAEEVRVLSALADNIAFAVESSKNEKALREREEHLRLIQDLGEAMREAPDADGVLPVALRMLGERLRVSRCAYADVDADGDRCTIPYDYTDSCASIVGQHRLSHFGPRVAAELRRGAGPVVVKDVDAEFPPAEAQMLGTIGIKAFICCSLLRHGVLRAMMAVHDSSPRDWSPNEVAITQEVVERCWATIEQRGAETKLRQSEALLRIAGRAARLGGWSIDLPDGLITWSDEVCAIHEVPAGTQPTWEQAIAHYAPEVRETIGGRVLACALDGTPFDLELPIVTAKGRRMWVRAIGHAERSAADTISRVQGALQDIDDRRKLEAQFRQSQRMEAVGELSAGVAHDFNNILSVILSYAQMIAFELKPGEAFRADIEEIRMAGERGADLTRQLLAFSRQQALEPKVLDLNQTIAGMERMLRRLLGAGIELTTLSTDKLWNVRADPGQIEQVVMNLAVNSRDAMPRGGKLTIDLKNVELDEDYANTHHEVRAGSYVMLAVADSGTGIDRDTLGRIFEPFFTTKEKGKGTGLGLATVFGIVKQSGGHIWVYSEPGQGTTFKVYLPRVAGGAVVMGSDRPAARSGRGSETVLLVDDDDQVRAVARTILRRNGYVVLEASNGGEALLICEQHTAKIHLLLTDVVLPRMSGRQLAERVATMRFGIKVLFMSGYTDGTVPQHGILESDVAYLQKPITPDALTRKVRDVLEA